MPFGDLKPEQEVAQFVAHKNSNYSGGLGCSLLGRKRNFIGQDTCSERCMISYCP